MAGSDMDDAVEGQQDAPDRRPAWLGEILAAVHQQTAQIQQQATRIEGLENLARGSITGGVTIGPPITGSGPVKRPRHKMDDPERFDGTDLSLYPQFEGLLFAKLEIDSEAIGNEKEKVWYGFSRLKDGAAGRIYPWIDTYKNRPAVFTVNNFFSQMQLAFKDPTLREKALNRLNSLRQGNRFFSELLSELDRLLLEAGGHEWEDRIKKGYVKAALNFALRERLVTVSEEPSYEGYCRQVKEIADRMAELQQLQRSGPSRRNPASSASILPRHDAADNTNSTSATPIPNLDSMDWEPSSSRAQKPNGKRAKWVSKAELGKRRQNGNCLRCGATGHRVRDCPFLPPQPPQPKASNVDITGALLEDDDELPKREIQPSLEKQLGNVSLL
jgi:hypothetical protein